MNTDSNPLAPRFLLVESGGRESWFEIPEGETIIGRTAGVDVILAEKKASRRHCVLTRTGEDIVLADLGSTNGTLLNGRTITSAMPLRTGDVIEIGDTRLHLDRARPDGIAPAAARRAAEAGGTTTTVRSRPRGRSRRSGGSRRGRSGTAAAAAVVLLAALALKFTGVLDGSAPAKPPGIERTPPAPIRIGSDLTARKATAELAATAGAPRAPGSGTADTPRRVAEPLAHAPSPPPDSDAGTRDDSTPDAPPRPPSAPTPAPPQPSPDTASLPATEARARFDALSNELQALLVDRRFAAALDVARSRAGLAGHPSLASRREEAKHGVEKTEALLLFADLLADAIRRRGSPVDGIPIFTGAPSRVAGADKDGLLVEAADAPRHFAWKVVRPEAMAALVRGLDLSPEALVLAGHWLLVHGLPAEGHRLLHGAETARAELKPRIDRLLALALDLDPAAGGFVYDGERYITAKNYARLELRTRLDAASERLRKGPDADFETALTVFREAGDDGAASFHRALLLARLTLLDGLAASNAAFRRVLEVAALRAELDLARESALELIFDTTRYPYPYRPPEASAEVSRSYAVVQAEVDRRVRRVKEIWDSPLRARLDASIRTAARRIAVIDAEIARLALGEVPERAAFLAWLPEDSELTVRNIAEGEAGQRLRVWNDAVTRENEGAISAATAEERRQVQITNAYRIMMNRHALRIDDRITRAARGHCQDMVRLGFFAHMSPVDGKKTPVDRARAEGYPGGVAENIAIARGPDGAHNGWTHSSGHHRNMLNGGWRVIGVGASGSRWCQNFSVADASEDLFRESGELFRGGAGPADEDGPETRR